jgi:IS5 family transposase
VENPYFQYFCGEEFFQHALVFDRSSLTRWRQRMGQEKLKALLQESLAVATRTDAMKLSDLACVVIDTTVQPKAVMFPTDAKLLNRARERLVRLAKKLGVSLRQSYARVGKLALIKHQRYAHAHQFKRANRSLRKLKTYLGRVIRDIERRIVGNEDLREAFVRPLFLARRVLEQERRQRGRKGLFPARARGRMHRQGQSAPALRVRGQGERRHHGETFRRRAVRHPCRSTARQSL